ncbi:MAG: DUF1080 domain-containing protein [Isosphaeraceae bacterium]|nr:DUF1080 domain-containing protein [Isosphaeraceae bacterium]
MQRSFRALGLGSILLCFPVTVVHAESTADLARTAAVVAALQNADGGFSAAPGQPSSLSATSSAVRTLKYTGGSIPDVLACIGYVKSCIDAVSGGFANTPGGTADVRTTAVGLMVAAELKVATDEMADRAVTFFCKHAQAFEDIRIAVAGLEAVNTKSPDFPRWTEQVEKLRNSEGTFGKGTDEARDTGGAAVALLRMGAKLDKREEIVRALKAGQRPDGAWGRGEGSSDLEATYRIMRCFYMLQEKPDLDRLRGFITRCRHSEGTYSTKPDAPADLGGTYFATIILRWARLLDGEPALVETLGFQQLFNGHDLSGWEGDTSLWSARDGMLVGTSPGLKHNDFLATEKSFADFNLKLTFRLIGSDSSNSGIQFRSVRVPGHEMSGYQADVGQNYWGCLYDESRRNKVLVQASAEASKKVHKSDWNEYTVRAMGSNITLSLNGTTSVKYTEDDPKIADDGKIAVQIHAGGPMQIQFKDIYIQPLPRPTATDLDKPGFHLRTIKANDADRKYVVFVPNGYDGSKAFPVVLFLHGSGERGKDGIGAVQAGLGPAIAGHPGDYAFIGVFPQAEKTWEADSEDAKLAVAALDDVVASYKTDPRRVVLTGLSMGGSGSWSVAAANPGRFAAVVPVCGRGKTEAVDLLKALPVWAFVGDADRDETVLNTRAMVQALRSAGNRAKETEYRGVGHNSWDRAYNDPALIEWMAAQARP